MMLIKVKMVLMKRTHGCGARLRMPIPRRSLAVVESATRVVEHMTLRSVVARAWPL